MRRTVVVAFFLMCGVAAAQQSRGYFFIAPGGATSSGNTQATIELGGGGEAVLGKGIGIGAELGALGPTSDFTGGVLGVFSPNGYYHFRHSPGKVDPFVTGGYSLFFRNGHANLFNFGGGVNYWLRPKLGFLVEIRDHVWTQQHVNLHYWGVRFGLVF